MEGPALKPVLTDEVGHIFWAHRKLGLGNLFLIGTDLAGDLIRLRQGDPAAADDRFEHRAARAAVERFERQNIKLTRHRSVFPMRGSVES